MGILALLHIHAQWLACCVEMEFHFSAFEADGSVLELSVAQDVRQLIERLQLGAEFTGLLVDDLLGLFVAEPPVGMDDTFSKPLFYQVGIAVHFEYGGEHEAVFIGPEGAKVIREALRKHGYHAVY